MKKVLILILIILLSVMAYYTMVNGLEIGDIKILSLEQIKEKNDGLTQEIAETERLMYSSYPAETENLDKAISEMLGAKEEYQDLANVSTEGELQQANRNETYKQEFLWTKIGRYATKEGVTLNFSIASSNSGEPNSKNLIFNLAGNYYAIINFVSDLEDDSELNFRIDNFKMLPGSDSSSRQATFTVKDVKIEMENVTETSSSTQTDTNSSTQSMNTESNNTNTTNTTNTTSTSSQSNSTQS